MSFRVKHLLVCICKCFVALLTDDGCLKANSHCTNRHRPTPDYSTTLLTSHDPSNGFSTCSISANKRRPMATDAGRGSTLIWQNQTKSLSAVCELAFRVTVHWHDVQKILVTKSIHREPWIIYSVIYSWSCDLNMAPHEVVIHCSVYLKKCKLLIWLECDCTCF